MKLKSFVAAAALSFAALPLQAATYVFGFSNEDGPVAGAVMGTIELPDGDGTFSASSVIVTNAPVALGYASQPFDVIPGWATIFANSFTVLSGEITGYDFVALEVDDVAPDSGLAFGPTAGGGALLSGYQSAHIFSGVADSDASSLVFAPLSTVAPVPLPAGLPLILTGLAGLAGLRMRKKRAVQA